MYTWEIMKKSIADTPDIKKAYEAIGKLSQQNRGSIYITGDLHGNFDRFSKVNFSELETLSKQDYLIICGDFGGIWDKGVSSEDEKQTLDELDLKNITICFVDGNHGVTRC